MEGRRCQCWILGPGIWNAGGLWLHLIPRRPGGDQLLSTSVSKDPLQARVFWNSPTVRMKILSPTLKWSLGFGNRCEHTNTSSGCKCSTVPNQLCREQPGMCNQEPWWPGTVHKCKRVSYFLLGNWTKILIAPFKPKTSFKANWILCPV